MNTREINLIKFYLTNLYNYCSEANLNLAYKDERYHGKQIIVSKAKNANSISNLEDFLNLFNYTTRTSVMDQLGTKYDEKLTLEILKYNWKNSDKTQKKFLISIINMMSNYYSEIDQNLLKALGDKKSIIYSKEDIQLFLTKAPPSLGNKLFSNVFETVFENFESEEREERDDILLKYFTIREKTINTNSYLKEELKNLLMKYYENDNEQLKKYGELFSIVNAYLEAEESDDFFYTNNNNELTLIVDYEKVKAVLQYNWDIDTYSAWINSLCQVIEAKEKRIKKIYKDDFKLTKTCHYKTIQVELKLANSMSEKEFKDILINFFTNISNEINEDYCDSVERKVLITKWWNAYQLTLDLERRNKGRVETVEKRQKL